MSQIDRNHSDHVDGLFVGKRYLIHDRDPLFTADHLGNEIIKGWATGSLLPRLFRQTLMERTSDASDWAAC